MKYTPDEIIDLCWENLPRANNRQDINNIRIAAHFAWEIKEMGGEEHRDFAYRNGTPIVPKGHCGHPIELLKRGFIDGKGWPKPEDKPNIKTFKWFDGNHYYATVNGVDVQIDGVVKWNSEKEAVAAANKYIKLKKLS